VDGSVAADVLPGMLLLGLGTGLAFNPLLLAAMNDVPATDSGVASGIVSTAFVMGGALGLAIIASVAAARTSALQAGGVGPLAALNAGYHVAFLVGAILSGVAALIGFAFLRTQPRAAAALNQPAI
jgi:sugar phosphate permease